MTDRKRRIDLNADVGEGLPVERDRAVMELMSSASIACGGHAGDIATMRRTLQIARELGLRAGAHPSYPDRENFGRTSMAMGAQALVDCVGEQVSALQEAALQTGTVVAYLKPHGALYNDAAVDPEVARAVATVAGLLGLPLMLLASARALDHLPGDGPPVIAEGFLDRGYRADGTLVPRGEPGALITDSSRAREQAVRLAQVVDSLCIHSDSLSAVSLARAARESLEAAGMRIEA
ncbi:MAG TPA: 5-oxoprolinase subunit PxpA [Actinomycetota bacterium]|nr:5-oxoprolinase subunit PxpA [Actinomycetota bacterium]